MIQSIKMFYFVQPQVRIFFNPKYGTEFVDFKFFSISETFISKLSAWKTQQTKNYFCAAFLL
jgi:hypothetical protein